MPGQGFAASAIRVDWDAVERCLPFRKDPESRKARERLFKIFDPNGNKILSLAETDKGIQDLAQRERCDDINNTPVINRAFHAARCMGGDDPETTHDEDSYIEFREFRCFLAYIRHYLELFQMFDEIDDSNDRRVSFDEFRRCVPLLEEWGCKPETLAAMKSNPAAVFAEIDTDRGGMILFDEFADWAVHQALDLADDAGDVDTCDPALLHIKQNKNIANRQAPKIAARDMRNGVGAAGRNILKAAYNM